MAFDHRAAVTYLFLIFDRNSSVGISVEYYTVNKTFNFSDGQLELIVGWETVTVDPINLNHSVISYVHLYVIMVLVDMAFDKMYDKRRKKLSYVKN